jgi:hypothetical protein
MAFGQQSGPPATHRQMKDLLDLLQDAGHIDFRDARGPMGFTQRQAAGKFTQAEAEAFIEQLQQAGGEGEPSVGSALRGFSTEELAAELQRRGWIVVEP